MRILVTGAAGFIGQHLTKNLIAKGHEVIGLDRKEVPAQDGLHVMRLDLLDEAATAACMRSMCPEAVLHLAARTDLGEKHDLSQYRDNIDAVDSLVSAIQHAPSIRRWVCTSSQLVNQVGRYPKCDTDYSPNTLYGESKVRTEKIVRSRDGGGRVWTIVRPTTIWGPGMNAHYLRFFAMIRDGRYFHVGRGPTLKSYGYVGNTAEQYAAILEAPDHRIHGRTFYMADYEPLAIEGWAEAFRRHLNAPRIRTIAPLVATTVARVGDVISLVRPSFPFTTFRLRNVLTAYQADVGPLQELCNSLPYTVDRGVDLTVQWLRDEWTKAGK